METNAGIAIISFLPFIFTVHTPEYESPRSGGNKPLDTYSPLTIVKLPPVADWRHGMIPFLWLFRPQFARLL